MNKIENLKKMLEEGSAFLVSQPVSRRYLLGFPSSAGTLLITPRGAYFIIDFRYVEAARAAVRDAEVVLQDKLYEQLNALISRDGVKNLTIENTCSIIEFETLKEKLSVNLDAAPCLSNAISDMRSIKTSEELEKIAAAQKITDAAFTHILGYIKEGMLECDVALELETFMRRQGAEALSFETICVAGKKSALPHGVPGQCEIKHGDFLTMDFGCIVDGYCSDMTRTVAIGEVSDEQKHVYNTVLKAQLAALAAAKPGMKGKELDAVARDIIYDAGFKGCFGHGLGHSLGLEVHESPRASVAEERELKAGMMMTIEPGIYLEGKFGVRIEDMVVLTPDGCKNFAQSDKSLIVL